MRRRSTHCCCAPRYKTFWPTSRPATGGGPATPCASYATPAAYGATRLRLVVAAVEIWLGLLFVLVGVATVRLRARWLPQLVLGTAVLALLGLAAVNPDHLIADRNVDRYRQTGRLDVRYLASLSADAAPALARLPEPLRSCALRDIAVELGDDDLRSANLGRARARRLLADQPVRPPDASCLIVPRW
ncbi:DUF4153 domain-containing protein [Micromonospora globbae]|uniref:DUF4153 domain-containing protein n=1 Tax=Micromonospora globbae TaxID=1894969 RepID=UPI0034211D4F